MGVPGVLHARTPVDEKSRATAHRIRLRRVLPLRADLTSHTIEIVRQGALDMPITILHSSAFVCGVGDPKLLARVDGGKRSGESAVEDDRMVRLNGLRHSLEIS